MTIDLGDLAPDRLDVIKRDNLIEMRIDKNGVTWAFCWNLRTWGSEKDVRMEVVKQEDSIFATREQLANLEKQFRLHSERNKQWMSDEDAKSEYKDKPVGKNTQRLWRIAKEAIKEENPDYIRNDDSDEAILFLILSRYIGDRVGDPE
jgi:hypothetical protein